MVERLESAVANLDREPSKKDLVLEAVEELRRATAETVSSKSGIDLKTVQNAFTELLRVGALKDTGEKQGRYRIVIPHSQPTKGTGTGTSEQEAFCEHGIPTTLPCDECDVDVIGRGK